MILPWPVQARAAELPGLAGGARGFTAQLELITPAFLAGANQQSAEDCTLRTGTLRGLLRWWWRTLHAGYLSGADLRRLEGAIWGDVDGGSPVTLRLEGLQPHSANIYDKAGIGKANQLPKPHGEKTTQGLFSLSYGMDDGGRENPKRRCFQPPGASWSVRISARDGHLPPATVRPASGREAGGRTAKLSVSAEAILNQVRAALWLLGQYGGVGARCRKGFGSLAVTLDGKGEEPALKALLAEAANLRKNLGLAEPSGRNKSTERLSPTFTDDAPMKVEVRIPAGNYWQVLDAVGAAYQAVAQKWKHDKRKAALGLPRKIHGPRNTPMPSQHDHQRPCSLEAAEPPDARRYASPVHICVSKAGEGWLVRAIGFPQCIYKSTRDTAEVIQDFLQAFEEHLTALADGVNSLPPARGGAGNLAAPSSGPQKRAWGTPVRVKLVAARDNPNTFNVQEPGWPQGTLTVGKPPAEMPGVGAEIDVEIHVDDPKRPQYRWPSGPKAPPKSKVNNPARRY